MKRRKFFTALAGGVATLYGAKKAEELINSNPELIAGHSAIENDLLIPKNDSTLFVDYEIKSSGFLFPIKTIRITSSEIKLIDEFQAIKVEPRLHLGETVKIPHTMTSSGYSEIFIVMGVRDGWYELACSRDEISLINIIEGQEIYSVGGSVYFEDNE